MRRTGGDQEVIVGFGRPFTDEALGAKRLAGVGLCGALALEATLAWLWRRAAEQRERALRLWDLARRRQGGAKVSDVSIFHVSSRPILFL